MGKWVIKTSGDYRGFMRDMQEYFQTLASLCKTASADEIYHCLLDVLKDSVPLAPIDEGALRESGHVSVNGVRYARGQTSGSVSELTTFDPSLNADTVNFEIGYTAEAGGTGREGDVNTYAVVQHEHTEFNHPKGGQAKFLETPLRLHRGTWRKRIADRVKKEVKGV